MSERNQPEEKSGRGGSGQKRVLFWFAIGLLIATPIAAGLLWFYFLPTRVGTDQALSFVNRQLASASNLRLSSDVVTPIWNGMILTDVRVEVERDGVWRPLLRSPEITIDVSLLDLALSRRQTFTVEAKSPILTLFHDEAGDAVLPVLRSGGKKERSSSDSDSREGDGFHLRLEGAQFWVTKDENTVVWWRNGTLQVDALPRSDGYDIEIIEGGGFLPQLGLVVGELHGRGAVTGEGFFVDELSVQTDAGSVAASGHLLDQQLTAQLSAEQWPWEFFAEILEQPGVDVPGTVQIKAEISGPLKSPVVVTELDGFWREEAFRAVLSGELDDPAIRLTSARVEWGATTIEGTGRFQFDGRWSLAANVAGLDLAQLKRLAPWISLPVSDLSGPMRMEGDRGRLRVIHEDLSGSFAGIPLEEVAGEWSLDGRAVEWTGMGSAADGVVEASGTWDGEQLAVRGSGDGVRLAALHDLHHSLSHFESGRGRFEFEAVGPSGAVDIIGRSQLSGASWRWFGAGELGVDFDGRLGGGNDSLNLVVRGSDFTAQGTPFDTVTARGRWRRGEMRVSSLHVARGDTSISASFTTVILESGWAINASSLRLRAGEAILIADGPVRLDFADGGLDFQTFNLRGNAGQCQLAGWVRGVDANLSVTTQDLDLGLVLGGLMETPITGRVDLDAHVTSGEDRLHLVLEAAAPAVRYGEAEMESLVASLVIGRDGSSVDIEHLDFHSSAGHLTASGSGLLPEGAVSAEQPWWKPLGKMQTWRGTARAENLDLSILSQLIPGEREITGEVNAIIDLQGPASNRVGRTDGSISGFSLSGYRFDEVAWEASYDDERLTITGLSASVGEDALRFSGHLPLTLVWGEKTAAWFPDRPMDLRVELPEGTVRHLPLFLPQLAAAEGKVAADIRLRGTPHQPQLHGSLDLSEAGIRVTGREEIYRDLHASVQLEGERIVIRDIEARQGSDGGLKGSGEYWLFGENAGQYRLELRAENALAQASGEYAVSFDGDFVVTDGPRIPGVVIAIPHVQGKLQVRTGVILYDFSDPENVVYLTGPRQSPMYIYDLELEAPRRVYWRTPSANIELEANLNMSQSLEGLKMWGTMRSLRGTYYFLENKFTVDNGELIFDQAESMNPKITAAAVTRVTRAMGQKQYEKEDVHIELSGRVQKPEMRLWSSSGLGQTDIVSLLTVGRFGIGEDDYTGGDQRLLVGVTGTQYLVRQLSREFPEISPLLADIEVGTTVGKGSTGERIYTTVGLSRYFTPDLLLRYSQVVGGGGSGGVATDELNLWDVSAEYRIGRLFFLTGEIIERRVTSSLGSGTPEHEVQYNLDVRARFEY
jgi:hypothetical protein